MWERWGHTSEFPSGVHWPILKNQKNQTLEKMKKFAGDIIILPMCTKNHNHMRYSSCDIKWERIFCHFGPFFEFFNSCMLTQIWSACTDIIFCHFRPFFALLRHYWPQKLKFAINAKKALEILSFYTCVPLIKIIWCMVPEIWSSTTDGIFWSSSAIFCPFTPLTPWKMKISKKKKKKPWRYHHLTQVYQKSW